MSEAKSLYLDARVRIAQSAVPEWVNREGLIIITSQEWNQPERYWVDLGVEDPPAGPFLAEHLEKVADRCERCGAPIEFVTEGPDPHWWRHTERVPAGETDRPHPATPLPGARGWGERQKYVFPEDDE